MQVREKRVVGRGRFQSRLFYAAEHVNRIAPSGLPQVAIKSAEQIDARMVPAPAQVVGNGQKWLQRIRQRRTNFIRSDGFHGVLRSEWSDARTARKGETARRNARLGDGNVSGSAAKKSRRFNNRSMKDAGKFVNGTAGGECSANKQDFLAHCRMGSCV
jgi:hypothetical protein